MVVSWCPAGILVVSCWSPVLLLVASLPLSVVVVSWSLSSLSHGRGFCWSSDLGVS